MSLGIRMKLWREKKGWGQRELARQALVHVSQISRLESGKRDKIDLDAAVRLARALGVSLDYLAGMYDEPEAVRSALLPPASMIRRLMAETS